MFLKALWDVLLSRKHVSGSSVVRCKSKTQHSRLAKLTPPSLPVVLKRPRLFRLLDKSRKRPVTWIAAPAGSGKTTLVASYLKARRLPVLWYRLDETDADSSSFFHFLSLAAKSLAPRVRTPLPVLTPEYALGLPTFARRFFQELCARLPRRCVLVLDNYQEVPDQSVLHHMLAQAFQEVPTSVTVIVMSRQDPPAAMASLQSGQTMTHIGAEPLTLLRSEAKAIVRLHMKGRADRAMKTLVDDIYDRVGGWAAGVTLTLEHIKSLESTIPDRVVKTPETVFRYLAGEVLERLTPDKRELLLQTSVLSDISVPMAEQLSGLPDAGDILMELHAGRYFTERRQETDSSYRYHPLFRDFLLHQAQQVLGPIEFRALQRKAAELLVSSGRIEDGVLLLQAAEDWDGLVPVILAQANRLIEAGRVQTLETWILSMPESVRDEIPWLNFWLATSKVAFSPDESYGLYRQVFHQFQSRGDQVGSLMSWCGAVRGILIRWTGMTRLDEWLDLFPIIHPEGAPYPSVEVEAHVADCMAGAIMQRRPYRSDARAWLDSAVCLAEHLPPAMQTGSRYMLEIYYLWNGEFEAASAGLEQYSCLAHKFRWNPITTIFFHTLHSTVAWFRCDFDCGRIHFKKAREVAHETGLHLLDGFILGQGAINETFAGNLDGAEALLKESDLATQPVGGIHRAHYLHTLAWVTLLRGNAETARIHIEQSLSILAGEGGFMFGEGANGVVAAHVLRALGKSAEAAQWVERTLQIADQMKSDLLRFGARTIAAQLAFDRGDEKAGHEELAKAFTIGVAKELMQYSGMERHVMTSLCAKALEAGIHVPFVQRMIKKHRFAAPPEAQLIDAWPWRVKIHMFGKLVVEVDGKPLEKQRKAPHRLLELLAAIIAFGGQDVPVSRLIDALWPEADGDTAQENFKKSIARLRKLLVINDVIQWKDGKISLNRDLCWIDTLAFEQLTRRAEAGHPNDNKLQTQAIRLYKGPFLGHGEIPAWARFRRDQMHAKFSSLAGHCQNQYEATGNCENPIFFPEQTLR